MCVSNAVSSTKNEFDTIFYKCDKLAGAWQWQSKQQQSKHQMRCKQTNVIFFNQIQQMSKTAVWTASISLNNFNTKFFNFAQPGHGIMSTCMYSGHKNYSYTPHKLQMARMWTTNVTYSIIRRPAVSPGSVVAKSLCTSIETIELVQMSTIVSFLQKYEIARHTDCSDFVWILSTLCQQAQQLFSFWVFYFIILFC